MKNKIYMVITVRRNVVLDLMDVSSESYNEKTPRGCQEIQNKPKIKIIKCPNCNQKIDIRQEKRK